MKSNLIIWWKATKSGSRSKAIALFGSHTTPFKVSIERENFKAIQVVDLNRLSASKVLEKIQNYI